MGPCQTKRSLSEWERIFMKDISDKVLISKIYKNTYNSTSKKHRTGLKNEQRT